MKEVKRVYRVLRGGSWDLNPGSCRPAIRDGGNPVYRYGERGFRVLRVPRTHQVRKK
jgi:formylglycine-generating enzyme required for sulfatase activity